MKVLMISTDRKIFEEGSAVRHRMVEYGGIVDELHIIVFATRKSEIRNPTPNTKAELGTGQESETINKFEIQISQNVFAYPTNSYSRWLYVFDAICIGRRIYGSFMAHLWLTPLETLRTRSPFTRKRYHQEKSHAKNCRASLTGLITAQDPFETGLAGWIIARVSRTPLQIQIHTDFLNSYFKRHSFLNRVRILIARFLLPKADCIRAVSTRIAESIKSNIKGPRIPEQSSVRGRQMLNVSVLPIYIDAGHIRTARPAKLHKEFAFTILWVGRLEPEKNPMLALESFARFARGNPDAGFVFIGDGSQRDRLKWHTEQFGIANRVLFAGWRDDVAPWYKAANALLVTSEYEGYGRHIVEARVAGLPVVSTDVGVAREAGAYIAEADPRACAEALSAVYSEKTNEQSFRYQYEDEEQYLEALKFAWSRCGLPETVSPAD